MQRVLQFLRMDILATGDDELIGPSRNEIQPILRQPRSPIAITPACWSRVLPSR